MKPAIEEYISQIEQIRKERNQRTAANPLDWINLAGLFWLEEGENTFGSGDEAKISLPQFPRPICGSLRFDNGKVTATVPPESNMTINGGPILNRPLFTDKDKQADLLEIGSLAMRVIVRGDVTLLRVWDKDSENIRHFAGFKYYPTDPRYKVTAKFIRYVPHKPTVRVEGIGTEIPTFFIGRAQFTLNGAECKLEAEESGDKLLFNFKDLTNGDTTYGGGRRFYLPPPEGDEIVLDFNLADNWPCAYTPFATCPIPPKENKLNVRIEAGELKFKD